jgi:hypothetical protein
MKGWYLRDVVNRSVMKGDIMENFPDGKQILMELYSPRSGMGEKALRQIFTAAELKRIRNVANALTIASKRQAQGAGGMAIQLTQFPAMASVVTGVGGSEVQKAAYTILIAPEVMGKIMLTQTGSKWLTEGLLKIPRGTPQMSAAVLRLTNMSDKIEKELQKQFEE